MKLSGRDRAKVNAALLELRHHGHDVGEVTGLAAKIIAMGTPPRLAYERAFNGFVERNPSFHAPLQRLGQFIDAADDRTLASYNAAMSGYIATGNPAHLEPITATVRQGLIEMAERTGDAGFVDGLNDTPAPAPAPTVTTAAESLDAPQEARRGHGVTGYTAPTKAPETAAAAPGDSPNSPQGTT